MKTSLPLSSLSKENRKNIRGIAFDVDDTFTSKGKLSSEAYQALWSLKSAGFACVPITGRPAGWCDHWVRMWPVDAVVGENGSFVYYMDEGVRKTIYTESVDHKSLEKLAGLWKKIKSRWPHAELASDQKFREFDIAVDIAEAVKPWANSDIQELVQIAGQMSAHAKVSSIHVNIWFGEQDKKSGFLNLLSAIPKYSPLSNLPPEKSKWIFAGDSPNDEPLFKFFDQSVGVANIANFLDQMKTHPTFVTPSESGMGFCELAHCLLQSNQ